MLTHLWWLYIHTPGTVHHPSLPCPQSPANWATLVNNLICRREGTQWHYSEYIYVSNIFCNMLFLLSSKNYNSFFCRLHEQSFFHKFFGWHKNSIINPSAVIIILFSITWWDMIRSHTIIYGHTEQHYHTYTYTVSHDQWHDKLKIIENLCSIFLRVSQQYSLGWDSSSL